MPKMITCLRNGKRISINDALAKRDFAKSRGLPAPTFECEECKLPVIAHKESGYAHAHFEPHSRAKRKLLAKRSSAARLKGNNENPTR